MNFSIIVAVDKNFGIGKNNTIPWKLSADLKYFAKVTTIVAGPDKVNAVIMGRKTWESLPPKSRPLKNRLNIVLSRNSDIKMPEGVLHASSLEEALKKIEEMNQASKKTENTFIIGGGKVFKEAVHHSECEKIYLTKIDADFDCDVFFPKFDESEFILKNQSEMMMENDLKFQFLIYQK